MANSLASTFTIGDMSVRQLDGLFSLNDLHKAAGNESRHEPANFLRIEQTKALVEELSSAETQTLKTVIGKGKAQGTYACRELVIAYAAWISAVFHLKVIRVFLNAISPALPNVITPAQAQHLRELVQLVVETGKQSHGETWTRLHRKMKKNSYLALRPDQFDAACEYLRGKFDGESIASLIQKHLPALPAPATTENAMTTTEAPSLKNRRWLVYFDHTGREHHEAVPNDAMVCSPKEIPGLLLNERNGIFTAKDVLEIAGHANLRMMTEVCSLELRSKAKLVRDEIRTFGTTDLSEIAKTAWLELSLRGEFQGAKA